MKSEWVAGIASECMAGFIGIRNEGYRYLDTVHNKAWLEGLAGWPLRKETRPRMLERILPDTDDQWTCFLWSRRRLTDISIAQARLNDPSPGKHG